MRSALPVLPDDRFRCDALACVLRARVCIRRQILVELELRPGTSPSAKAERRPRRAEAGRTLAALARHLGKRGRAPEFPSCLRCSQGARIRARLGDACAAGVRTGGRSDRAAYAAWRGLNEVPGEPMIVDHLR